MSRAVFVAARAIFAGFWIATAAYCVIAFNPFTYVEVLQFAVVPALNAFARIHHYLYWVAFAAVLFTLREDVKRPATRWLVIGFAGVTGAAGIALLVHPLLASLANDASSLRLGFVALVPLAWVAVIDLRGHAGRIAWSATEPEEDRRLFRAALATGVFLAILFTGIVVVRFGTVFVRAAAFSLASHVLVFLGLFVAIGVVRSLAAILSKSAAAEFVLVALAAASALAAVVRGWVLGAVSLAGRPDIAIVFAGAIVLSYAGVACRSFERSGRSASSGALVFLAPLAPGPQTPRIARLAIFALLAVTAFAAATTAAVMDWNFLLQKLTALVVWVFAFAACYAAMPVPAGRHRAAAAYLGVCVIALGAFKGLSVWKGASPALDAYAGRDPSFKVVRDLLRRPQGTASRDDAAYYRYLQDRTNIPRSVHIEPADIRFVPELSASSGPKPNVFIFVLDSLRRDYVSAYNPAVTFTPAIDAFAKDSVVFTNAFTRYGGTGLSEPAIWVGGMLPHQQYVTPFHPLNALEKLVQAEGYTSFISIDTILRLILVPDAATVEIDRGVLTHDLKLARSLADLAGRLKRGEAQGRPVFAYAQPQDLHISTITREGGSVPAGESYPGFYAPYASRLKSADAGFGAFLAALRELGMYDDSIIVLTSDHGDSLGEDGRWGHAYTIYPEILRIPLIVHLPPSLRSRRAVNPSGLTFLTDLTPTLYALLGHEPELRNDVFGRPLFAPSARDLPAAGRADADVLVASSYGPVYGILAANGRSLYIADAVNYTESLLDPGGGPAAPAIPLTDEKRAAYREAVRKAVGSIGAYYRVPEVP
jgi:hypothetical protein